MHVCMYARVKSLVVWICFSPITFTLSVCVNILVRREWREAKPKERTRVKVWLLPNCSLEPRPLFCASLRPFWPPPLFSASPPCGPPSTGPRIPPSGRTSGCWSRTTSRCIAARTANRPRPRGRWRVRDTAWRTQCCSRTWRSGRAIWYRR